MKRFKFRLDPVIRYRQYLERIARIELAREKQALIESKNRIREIKQARRNTARELDREQAQGIEVDRYRVFTGYLQGLLHEIESESERLVEIGVRIRQKQEAVKAETIKKKTLEWLKQTEYNKYLEWINRAEQKAADDLSGLRRKSVSSRQ
ncbi:MAG: flagellar export protein FliJ [Deltaproteobacteria bacterium]|nr:flagellar export protein FliJ [Deltaproteobacteria bacterium]MBW2018955.1 flagellar export protein FliJ [Deltaproteobacteria bacterium]MBW2073170.1 flagellar export protein FliJ [Deltaproteobacteria bacterium]